MSGPYAQLGFWEEAPLRRRRPNGYQPVKPLTRPCDVCGKPVPQTTGRGRMRKVCSTKCFGTRRYYRLKQTCSRCGVSKTEGHGRYCDECTMRARLMAWSRRHGLSLTELVALYLEQNCQCAVCHTPMVWVRSERSMHIDHDHACCPGELSCGACVRGLLCPLCNVGLGSFLDDVDRLAGGIEYLRRPARSLSLIHI